VTPRQPIKPITPSPEDVDRLLQAVYLTERILIHLAELYDQYNVEMDEARSQWFGRTTRELHRQTENLDVHIRLLLDDRARQLGVPPTPPVIPPTRQERRSQTSDRRVDQAADRRGRERREPGVDRGWGDERRQTARRQLPSRRLLPDRRQPDAGDSDRPAA
jgi:hypothetical protein